MSALWVSDHTVRKWFLHKECEIFKEKYDEVESQILDISCMDDFLSGMFVHVCFWTYPTYMYSIFAGKIVLIPVNSV